MNSTTEVYYVALMKNGNFCYLTNGPFVNREEADRVCNLGIDSRTCYLKVAVQTIEIQIGE